MNTSINHARFIVNHSWFVQSNKMVFMGTRADIKDVLADNLSELMRRKYGKNNQTQLHKDSGVSQATIGRIINRNNAALIDTVDTLADFFGLSAWQLTAPNLGEDIISKGKAEKEQLTQLSEDWELLPDVFKLIIRKKAHDLLLYWESLPSFIKDSDSLKAPENGKYYDWERSIEEDMQKRLQLHRDEQARGEDRRKSTIITIEGERDPERRPKAKKLEGNNK